MRNDELKTLFRGIVSRITGLSTDNNKSVRFQYGTLLETGSAPDFKRLEDVIFINLLPEDEPYNRQRESALTVDADGGMHYVETRTDVWRAHFTCYGPHAFEYAQKLRSGFSRPDIKLMLDRNQLHRVPSTAAIVHAPELIKAEWWERYDLDVVFYEAVRESVSADGIVGSIDSVGITLATEQKEMKIMKE